MANEDLIAVNGFCTYHRIEYTFLTSLEEAGLVRFTRINETPYIAHEHLQALEKMTRLHRELDVNIPGIEVIIHMLDHMQEMQQSITALQNKLRFYDEL